MKERCGFNETSLEWRNCTAPPWLELWSKELRATVVRHYRAPWPEQVRGDFDANRTSLERDMCFYKIKSLLTCVCALLPCHPHSDILLLPHWATCFPYLPLFPHFAEFLACGTRSLYTMYIKLKETCLSYGKCSTRQILKVDPRTTSDGWDTPRIRRTSHRSKRGFEDSRDLEFPPRLSSTGLLVDVGIYTHLYEERQV